MANTYTKRTLVDGSRNLVVNVYGLADGVAGNETGAVLLDASTYSPAYTFFSLKKVHFNGSSGVGVTLYMDASTPVAIATYDNASNNEDDWTPYGGISNANEAGATGDITFDTVGFDAAGDEFHMILWLQKVVKPTIVAGEVAEEHTVPGQSQAGNPSIGDMTPFD